MAFQNQFTLSLELMSLIPPIVSAAESGYAKAMKLARELQSSGSDIVVEEDFAELFGHSRIATQMESSFRTIVANSSAPRTLCDGIFLQSGPGPTVLRALKSQNTIYFSTVVQCSFLACVHNKASLAAVLSQFLQNRATVASQKHTRGHHSETARDAPADMLIQGFLQACQDQTAEYDWCRNLDAVRETLTLGTDASMEGIPRVIFEGLLGMLPLVQHMPDHFVDIRTESGLCSIIVWAHHILGLSVLVKTKSERPYQDVRFGLAPEQVVVEFDPDHTWKDNTITLLSSAGEELLSLKPEPDEEKIQSSLKRPARGYAERILRKEFNDEEQVERLVIEVSLIICAFAICVSKKLYRVEPLRSVNRSDSSEENISSSNRDEKDEEIKLQHSIPESAVFEAVRVLFDQKLDKNTIDDYVQLFKGVNPLAKPPRSFIPILKECHDSTRVWNRVTFLAVQLASTVVAFSHVTEMDIASDFLISAAAPVTMTEFYHNVWSWNGEDLIPVEKTDFLNCWRY
ncbi:hypothetical protein KXX31_006759 [Aspergillus fumigatus]|nr:hypothetical protein KXX31_006759 [Aspergillus fumigatus]